MRSAPGLVVYLVRHGEPDWESMNLRCLPGAVNDLVELTARGLTQAGRAATELRDVGAARVVSSPMTRALQTAAGIAGQLGLPLSVEFDLREWCPDMTYRWTTAAEAHTSYQDMLDCDGEWPAGQVRAWEPLSAVRRRARAALDRATADGGSVVAVCHGVVIQSLTGDVDTSYGGIRRLDLTGSAAGDAAGSGEMPSTQRVRTPNS